MAGSQQGYSRSRFLLSIALLLLIGIGGFSWLHVMSTGQARSNGLNFDMVDDSTIERGRYLAIAGNCASCHTTGDGGIMAGGVAFETPFGKIYSTNITPDRDTGIGEWSGEQFLTSMRRGVRADGEAFVPRVSVHRFYENDRRGYCRSLRLFEKFTCCTTGDA